MQQRLRVGMVAHVFGLRDGQGRVNYEVAAGAIRAGLELTLIAERCADGLLLSQDHGLILLPESRLPSRLLKNLSFAARSARALKKHRRRLDVVQANGFLTFARADIAAAHFVHSAWLKHPAYPFQLSTLKPYHLYQRFFTSFSSWQERRVYQQAKRVIAVSRKTAREVAALGVDPSRISVIYNGVDLESYYPGESERSYFGLPLLVPMALFVGDLKTPRKNLGTVLHAMVEVPDLHLAVAGQIEGSAFPGMARKLGLETRVHFLGKTGEVARLMRSADFFVFPSLYEAHPLVVMEAMASGLPVIVSSCIAAGEDFASVTVMLENPLDASALASLMRELIQSPAQMKELGHAAREYALGMSWERTASKYLEVYMDLATENLAQASAGSTRRASSPRAS